MTFQFQMPTQVILGDNCVRNNAALLRKFGSKALIVTGAHSAKKNGSLDDVLSALAENKQDHAIFEQVQPNPTISCVYEGAAMAKAQGADFIIAIGGGSPMDAAKAIALLARQDLSEEQLFSGPYAHDILPMVHIPTTAGTGSEVTHYSILTNDKAQSKTNIATPVIFPSLAMLDARYTTSLPLKTTINTALDALSHCIEGFLSVRASSLSDLLALEGMRLIAACFSALKSGQIRQADRENLLYASMLGGVVITQTGTVAIHALGYSLTYFKGIDHGRANALLLGDYLKALEASIPERIQKIVSQMGFASLTDLEDAFESLLGPRETILDSEVSTFSQMAMKTRNIGNCLVTPTLSDLEAILVHSLKS